MLGEIHKAAERAAVLTRQLLAFSRKQILAPRILNVNEVVTTMEKMLARLIGEDVTLHTKLSPTLKPISADAGQLEQVLMNLAVNARDAMPQGGELLIETANVQCDASYSRTHAQVVPGDYVMVAITDSGCGMDEATQARIFEPFFTTKEPGKGTGLGLATVYGIVKQSGGHIWVYSQPGHGTTFKLYFPIAEVPQATREQRPSADGQLRGNETVLLVEDDSALRALGRSVLQMYGYTVLEADGPAEAIRLSKTYAGPIDLLLTDVVMPQLNGKRLSELLMPDRPEMKVLFMSGYTDDAVIRQGIFEAGVNFIQKPFVPAALSAKIREVLDSQNAGSATEASATTEKPVELAGASA
jgi:CheY-like chemotaxis protein